jgi:hypothetical protein
MKSYYIPEPMSKEVWDAAQEIINSWKDLEYKKPLFYGTDVAGSMEEQLKIEINHILDSGANEIRLVELFHKYADKKARQMVLEYARWFEDQGPPEFKQEDWMVEQNVKSFYDPRL